MDLNDTYMMDLNKHQDQRYTWGDIVGRDLYLLGVNVLVLYKDAFERLELQVNVN